MSELYNKNEFPSIVYVAREIERATGFDMSQEGFHILTNDSPESREYKKQFPNSITLIPSSKPLDTYELLEHKDADIVIQGAAILVFKNTSRIEKICTEKKLRLLNPPAKLGTIIEEKVSQVAWLGELREFLPPHEITQLKKIVWEERPFVLQYNHAHSGEGTHFIQTEDQLRALQSKFPERDVRKTSYIQGPIFTSNTVITDDAVIPGNISMQITGITPFTDLPFATVGTDWKVAHSILSEADTHMYREIESKIGKKMQENGWRGLFGIDVVRAPDNTLFLIEINARQPASASVEAQLQKRNTILDAHLRALLQLPVASVLPLTRGGQIAQRVTHQNESHYPTHAYNTVITRIKKEDYIMLDEKTVRPDIYTSQEEIVKNLSKEALAIIQSYLSFSIGDISVSIPYYNNARQKIRGGLNVFTGKGSVPDIQEEVALLAHKGHISLDEFSADDFKKFLISNNIGIDCSGLAYFILDAEMQSRRKKSLTSVLSFKSIHGILGALRARLRPLQNTNVKVFADTENSSVVTLSEVQPGDLIILTGIEGEHVSDHILIIHSVVYKGAVPIKIHYTHTVAWSTDGTHDHGVRQGVIDITDSTNTITNQKWTEKGETNGKNETRARALKAKYIGIHRVR